MNEGTKSITDLSYLYSSSEGANDKMAKTIRMFLTGTPISIQQMELYSLSKDWSGLKQTVHGLKPQLGNFGAKTAESILKEIERIADEPSDTGRLSPLIENFRQQFEQINAELETALHNIEN